MRKIIERKRRQRMVAPMQAMEKKTDVRMTSSNWDDEQEEENYDEQLF